MSDQDRYETAGTTIRNLKEEITELKRKLAIIEVYLERHCECDICIGFDKPDIECEVNCRFEIDYEKLKQ